MAPPIPTPTHVRPSVNVPDELPDADDDDDALEDEEGLPLADEAPPEDAEDDDCPLEVVAADELDEPDEELAGEPELLELLELLDALEEVEGLPLLVLLVDVPEDDPADDETDAFETLGSVHFPLTQVCPSGHDAGSSAEHSTTSGHPWSTPNAQHQRTGAARFTNKKAIWFPRDPLKTRKAEGRARLTGTFFERVIGYWRNVWLSNDFWEGKGSSVLVGRRRATQKGHHCAGVCGSVRVSEVLDGVWPSK